MPIAKTPGSCKVCKHPDKAIIEKEWLLAMIRGRQADKTKLLDIYTASFGYKNDFEGRKYAARHLNGHVKHMNVEQMSEALHKSQRKVNAEAKKARANLKEVSDGLLDIGMEMVEYYQNHPEEARKDINFRDIFSAQDSVSKRMSVETGRDNLKLAMAKFLGGFDDAIPAKEAVEQLQSGSEE